MSDDELWTVIADPSRRSVIDALLTRGAATSTTLAAELPITRQAIEKHLAVLRRGGMVTHRRDGRAVRYAVQHDRLRAAARSLAEVATRWETAAGGPLDEPARTAPAHWDSPPG
jgi:ArsR family transcriptional regulator, cadmium/lead-responsive transcriptional repressor